MQYLVCFPGYIACLVVFACTDIPFRVLSYFTALWCSFILRFMVLPVSPMYFSPQPHSTLYTTPFTCSSSILFFTCVSWLRSVFPDHVFPDRKTNLMSRFLHFRSSLSLRPLMYGVINIAGCFDDSVLFASLGLGILFKHLVTTVDG